MHEATFSPDRRYRYRLEARLSDEEGVCMFLMLNPSRADEVRSDPTVTRSKGFARRWGYGTLWVCNLFALRTSYPTMLKEDFDPIGSRNGDEILTSARNADIIVCAWGNDGYFMGMDAKVLEMLNQNGLSDKLCHLGLTKNGRPRHPLYLPSDTQPIPWRQE